MAGRLISESLGRKQRIRPAMVIYGPTVPWTVARIGGVDVFSGRRLRKYLRAQARARREQRLTREEIARHPRGRRNRPPPSLERHSARRGAAGAPREIAAPVR